MYNKVQYQLNNRFFSYEGIHEYPAIYTIILDTDGCIRHGYGKYFDSDKNQWIDTAEPREDICRMMQDEIKKGNAKKIIE